MIWLGDSSLTWSKLSYSFTAVWTLPTPAVLPSLVPSQRSDQCLGLVAFLVSPGVFVFLLKCFNHKSLVCLIPPWHMLLGGLELTRTGKEPKSLMREVHTAVLLESGGDVGVG